MAFVIPKFRPATDEDEQVASPSVGGSSNSKGFYTPSFSKFLPSKKEQEEEERKRKLKELAEAEKNKPQEGNFLADTGKNLASLAGQVGGFLNDNLLKAVNPAERVKEEANKRMNEAIDKAVSEGKVSKEQAEIDRAAFNQANAPTKLTDLAEYATEQVVGLTKNIETGIKGGQARAGAGAGLMSPELVKNEVDYIKSEVKNGKISQQKADEMIKKLQGDSEKSIADLQKAEKETGYEYNPSQGALDTLEVAGGVTGIAGALQGARQAKKVADVVTPPTKPLDEGPVYIRNSQDAAKRQEAEDAQRLASITQKPDVGTAVERVAPAPGTTAKDPGMKQSSYTSKTLPNSDFVSTDIQGMHSANPAEYQATTNALRAERSLRLLDEEGVDQFGSTVKTRLSEPHITDQTAFDAQAYSQAREQQLAKLAPESPEAQALRDEIYTINNQLSEHFTRAGQLAQAAAIMSRQSPGGLRYFAQRKLSQAGVTLNDAKKAELEQIIEKVDGTKPKSEARAKAQHEVMYFIAENTPTRKADQITNFWRANLLTGVPTQLGAIVGNTTKALVTNFLDKPGQLMADWITSIFTGKRSATLGRLTDGYKGALEGAKVTGSKAYWQKGYNPLENAQSGQKWDNLSVVNYGDGKAGKLLGGYVNGVYRLTGASDPVFRTAAYRDALSSLARTEAVNRGIRGPERKAFIQEFLDNPPDEAASRAWNEASEATFQNETGLGNAIIKLRNSTKEGSVARALVDFIIPFRGVPSSIATDIVMRTPPAAAIKAIQLIVKGKKSGFDQREFTKVLAKGATSVPIIGLGYALGPENITGGYPKSKAERDQWLAEGKQPNSVRIGDEWYSLNYIQPFPTILAMGAKLKEAEEAGADIQEGILSALDEGKNSVISQSFLAGVQSFLDMVENPAEYGGRWIANVAGGFVPNVVRGAAVATDPIAREVEGAVDGVMAGIPGLRDDLPEKLDEAGNPIANPSQGLERFASPFRSSQIQQSEDTALMNKAVLPARRLADRRKPEIKSLLSQGRVEAAQRKIDEYNADLEEIIFPYLNESALTEEQQDVIDRLYIGSIGINEKGRPYLSTVKRD